MSPSISKEPKRVKTFGDLCLALRLSKAPPWSQERLAREIQLRYDEESNMLSTIKRLEQDDSIRMGSFFKIFATLLELPPADEQSYFLDVFRSLQQHGRMDSITSLHQTLTKESKS